LVTEVEKNVTFSAPTFLENASAFAKKGPAPVHLWNPPFCGDIDIRIARDGTWFYLGTPIGRKPLVKLFASILRRDGDEYFLVTPVEKVGIKVDDAPFVAVDFDVINPGPDQTFHFTTNVDDTVLASAEFPITVVLDPLTRQPSPHILVRRNLSALIDRKSFYRLIEHCTYSEIDGHSWFGVRSAGKFFPFTHSDELLL
jgi:uncharacterized protein